MKLRAVTIPEEEEFIPVAERIAAYGGATAVPAPVKLWNGVLWLRR